MTSGIKRSSRFAINAAYGVVGRRGGFASEIAGALDPVRSAVRSNRWRREGAPLRVSMVCGLIEF